MVWVRLIGCRPWARASARQRLTLRLAGVAFALAVVAPAALQVQTAMAVSVPRIYWGNDATNAIVAANLDGTNPNPNFATGAQNPGGLVVDGQYVYWSSFPAGAIGRANLNGTGVDRTSSAVSATLRTWQSTTSTSTGSTLLPARSESRTSTAPTSTRASSPARASRPW